MGHTALQVAVLGKVLHNIFKTPWRRSACHLNQSCFLSQSKDCPPKPLKLLFESKFLLCLKYFCLKQESHLTCCKSLTATTDFPSEVSDLSQRIALLLSHMIVDYECLITVSKETGCLMHSCIFPPNWSPTTLL